MKCSEKKIDFVAQGNNLTITNLGNVIFGPNKLVEIRKSSSTHPCLWCNKFKNVHLVQKTRLNVNSIIYIYYSLVWLYFCKTIFFLWYIFRTYIYKFYVLHSYLFLLLNVLYLTDSGRRRSLFLTLCIYIYMFVCMCTIITPDNEQPYIPQAKVPARSACQRATYTRCRRRRRRCLIKQTVDDASIQLYFVHTTYTTQKIHSLTSRYSVHWNLNFYICFGRVSLIYCLLPAILSHVTDVKRAVFFYISILLKE